MCKVDLLVAFLVAMRVDGQIGILELLFKTGLAASKGEARRLVQQGGVSVNDTKVSDIATSFSADQLNKGLIIKKGKKVFHKVIL